MVGFVEVFKLRPQVAETADLTDWILGVCAKHSLPDKIAFALQLCLDETVANIIEHSTGDGRGAAEIFVSISQEDAQVMMTVTDDGVEFNPTTFASWVARSSLDDASVGGLGIHLMRQFATNLKYERKEKRNCLHFVFT
jgi:anti-sigma regulatory factor (Ser/Thr protein kinase)